MPRMSKSQFAKLVDDQGRVEYTLPRMSEEAWSSLSIEAETQAEAEDKAMEEIKGGVHQEDYTALEEMLLMLLRKQGEPNHIMMGYLPEVQVCPGK